MKSQFSRGKNRVQSKWLNIKQDIAKTPCVALQKVIRYCSDKKMRGDYRMPESKNQALGQYSSQKHNKHFIHLPSSLRSHMPALASKSTYRENRQHTLPHTTVPGRTRPHCAA